MGFHANRKMALTKEQSEERERSTARVLVEWEKLRRMGKMFPIISDPPNLYKVNDLIDPWGDSKERITVEWLAGEVERVKGELLNDI